MSLPGFQFGQTLLRSLGSFWSLIWKDRDALRAVTEGIEETMAQSYFDMLEIIAAKSVHDIPIFKREKWRLLVFNESEKNKNTANLLKYGQEGAVYGPQPRGTFPEGFIFTYGGFVPGQFASFTLPTGMVKLESYVCNRIHEPSLVMINGVDFYIKDGVIFFNSNPFENPLVPIRTVYDSEGNPVDRQIALWALNSDHDFKFLYKNYGYVLDVFFESSENYKDILRTLLSLYTRGPKPESLVSSLNALYGLPVIREESETIEAIELIDGTRRIITDKHLYELPEDVSLHPTVFSGATLDLFSPLSDAVRIIDSVTKFGWWRNRDLLAIPPELLSDAYQSGLKIKNDEVSFSTEIGSTFPFEVIGEMTAEQQDVWDNFPVRIGMPVRIGDNAGTIKKLNWIFENFLKNHVFLLEIDLDQIDTRRFRSSTLTVLKETIPSYVYFIGTATKDLDDTYELTENEDSVIVNKGEYLEDDMESDVNFGDGRVSDGYFGIPAIGDLIPIGPPAEAAIGARSFIRGIRVTQRFKPCSQ